MSKRMALFADQCFGPTGTAAALLFVIALLLKLSFLFSVRSHPFVVFPVSDEAYFLQLARDILNSGLLQQEAFYFEPLYSYVMAGFFWLFGVDIFLFKVFQTVCGALNVLVVFYLGKTVFNSTKAGLTAAGLTLLYGPYYLYEVLLWKETFAVMVLNASILVLFMAVKRSGYLLYGIGGFFLGMASILRGNTLVAIPFVFLTLVWLSASRKAPRWTAPAWLFGVVLAILPLTLSNAITSNDFVLTTYQGGTNFFIGNHRGANGTYVPLRPEGQMPELEKIDAVSMAERAMGKKLKPSEVSNFWLRRGLSFIIHCPLEWLKLMLKKTQLLHANTELPDTIDFATFRTITPWLWVAFLPFSVIFGLAVSGFILSLSRWREHLLLYAATAGVVSSVVLFFVLSRYRFPVVSVYILFASYAVSQLLDLIKARKFGILLVPLGLMVLLSLFSWTSSPAPKPGATYNTLGFIYFKELADYGRAEEFFKKAVQDGPEVETFRTNLANALESQGKYREAVQEWTVALGILKKRQAVRQDPVLSEQISAVERTLKKLTETGGVN